MEGAVLAVAEADAEGGAELSLLLDYVEGRKGEAVADPYYGEAAGFEVTWAPVTIGVSGPPSATESEKMPTTAATA